MRMFRAEADEALLKQSGGSMPEGDDEIPYWCAGLSMTYTSWEISMIHRSLIDFMIFATY